MQDWPIINFIQYDEDALRRYQDWMLTPLRNIDGTPDPPQTRRLGETTVQYAKRMLGKQDYCATYLCRCWIWERPQQGWKLYASTRGLELSVLVPDDFDWAKRDENLVRANAALDAFLTTWGSDVGHE